MTILAQNLKTIRKNFGYTQLALSEVLDIGFRTYVRYEAGERDAPIALMVKLAKLGKISLDRLLTTKIDAEDLKIPDVEKTPKTSQKLEVIGGSLDEGRLMFKGLKNDFLISSNSGEKKLLAKFRKMDKARRDRCLADMEWWLNNGKSANKAGKTKKVSKNVVKAKNAARLKKMTKAIKKITLKG
ncbi:MAG: hypothetical protein NPINA01_09740 [Nitrospinaceae bacterium]|nr:MAG: hypothetical protein NPINA01_09740 [Nitrospinaceae bacterium]